MNPATRPRSRDFHGSGIPASLGRSPPFPAPTVSAVPSGESMEEKPHDPAPSSEVRSDAPLTIAEPVEAPPAAAEDAGEEAKSDEFAAMLETSLAASPAREPKEAKVGDKVKGKIVSIDEDTAFVDFGGRAEGALPLGPLKDAEGNLKAAVGDPIEA